MYKVQSVNNSVINEEAEEKWMGESITYLKYVWTINNHKACMTKKDFVTMLELHWTNNDLMNINFPIFVRHSGIVYLTTYMYYLYFVSD